MSQSIELTLTGARILVVEDDYLIADEIRASLACAGLEIIGPVGTVEQALRHIEMSRVDGAVVDIDLRGELSYPVLDSLLRHGIPVILVTGFDMQIVPEVYFGVPVLNKPAALDVIVAYFGNSAAVTVPHPLH